MRFGVVVALVFVLAAAVSADPYVLGSTLPSFGLEDQHGEWHEVDASVRLILFSRDMDGGDLIRDALADAEPGFLATHGAVYIADISRMPRIISRMIAVPRMRKRPYPLLLDRDGDLTADLPDEEGRATIIRLRESRIERVEHVDSADAVMAAIVAV